MNKFKKFLTVSIAGIMAFTTAAFAGCAPTNNDNTGDGGDKTNTGDNTGNNGGNTGDNTGNNGGNTGDNTGNNGGNTNPGIGVADTEPNAALLNGVLSQQYTAIGYAMTNNDTTNYKYYELTADYGKGTLIAGRNKTTTSKMDQTAKMNYTDGDADIEIKDVRTSTDKKDSYYNRTDYEYVFLRDWNSFSADKRDEETGAYVKITDFSDITMYYGGSAMGEMPVDFEEIGGMGGVANMGLATENFAILALGNYFGGLTVDGNKATVDMNKTAYNLAQQINAVLDTIDENTTIGDLLKNETIKKVMTALLGSLPADQVLELVNTALGAVPTIGPMLTAFGIDLSKILVKPDDGMSSYDYLVKVISSNELKNAINKVIEAIPSAPAIVLPSTLDVMTVDFFLKLAGLNINAVKAMVKQYTDGISETMIDITTNREYEDKFVSGEYDGDEYHETITEISCTLPTNNKISNLKVEFTLDNNKVKTQKITATLAEEYHRVDVHTEEPSYEVSNSNMTISMTIDYTDTKYTLTDIGNCKTLESRQEYTDSHTFSIGINLDSYELYNYEGGNYYPDHSYYYYIIKPVLKDGVITGFQYKDGNDSEAVYQTLGDKLSIQVTLINEDYWKDPEGGAAQPREKTVNILLTVEIEEEYDNHYTMLMYNEQYNIGANTYIYPGDVYYSNTVKGILAGIPSVRVTGNN